MFCLEQLTVARLQTCSGALLICLRLRTRWLAKSFPLSTVDVRLPGWPSILHFRDIRAEGVSDQRLIFS